MLSGLLRRLGIERWGTVRMLGGIELRAPVNTPAWGRVAERGWFELDTELFLRYVVQRGATVVDVGANEGVVSIYAASVAEGVDVVAFEPDPVPRAILERVVARNGVAVEVVPAAIDSQRTLDAAVAGRKVDVIKVDIDGGELRVLEGARATLADRPALAVELSAGANSFGYSAGELLAFLGDLGYVVYGTRMKFAHARELRSLDDLEALPVRLDRNEVANLYCITERVPVEAIWPPRFVPAAYRRHFLSDEPFASAAEFWAAYQAELSASLR